MIWLKHIQRFISLITLSVVLLSCSGCGSWARLNEDKTFKENVDAFFDALDEGDTDEIKSLFSNTVIREYDDLDEQIDKLISVYPKGETTVMLDGSLGGDYKDELGNFMSSANSTFTVTVSDQTFWVYMELVYEDDFSEDNIGFKHVCICTADEYYVPYNSDDPSYSTSDIGLFVYTDLESGKEIR